VHCEREREGGLLTSGRQESIADVVALRKEEDRANGGFLRGGTKKKTSEPCYSTRLQERLDAAEGGREERI